MSEHPNPMEHATAWLHKRNLPFKQKTPYQLKIASAGLRGVSYYPHKETIFIDGEVAAEDAKGLGAFEKVLIDLGYLPPGPTPTLSPPSQSPTL